MYRNQLNKYNFYYRFQIVFNSFLLIYITLLYLAFLSLNDFSLILIEAHLITLFGLTIVGRYLSKRNWLDLYLLFLMIFFLFMLTRPFLHLIGYNNIVNYGEEHWFLIRSNFTFKSSTLIKINFILAFSILFLNYGIIIGDKKLYNADKKIKNKSKILNLRIGYFFFLIGGFAFSYKVLFYVDILMNEGYFYLYSGLYSLPLWVRIFDDFFLIGYAVIISNYIPFKKAIIITLIFLGLYSTMLLAGMRGEFFSIVLGAIWILHKIYNLKIKVSFIILFVFLMIFLSWYSNSLKSTLDTEIGFDFLGALELFFYSQGVSVLVLGYVIEFENYFTDIYSGVRHLISPIVALFLTLIGEMKPRQEMSPETVYSIGERLQFLTSPSQYYAGAGAGSSFVAELFSLGGGVLFLAIGCFFLGYFVSFINNKLIYNKHGIFLSVLIVPALFWMSRANYIYPFQKYFFGVFLLYFISIFYLMLSTKKKR